MSLEELKVALSGAVVVPLTYSLTISPRVATLTSFWYDELDTDPILAFFGIGTISQAHTNSSNNQPIYSKLVKNSPKISYNFSKNPNILPKN